LQASESAAAATSYKMLDAVRMTICLNMIAVGLCLMILPHRPISLSTHNVRFPSIRLVADHYSYSLSRVVFYASSPGLTL